MKRGKMVKKKLSIQYLGLWEHPVRVINNYQLYLASKSNGKKTVVFTFLWTKYLYFFLEMNDVHTVPAL